jgi:integrase
LVFCFIYHVKPKGSEINSLIDASEHLRDRAFISMLYELGARIGEIGGLSVKEVTKDRYGYLVDLEGKTGHRTPRIVMSDAYLTHWLNSHPHKHKPDAPLWVMIGNRSKGDEIMSQVVKDPEIMQAIVKRMAQMGLGDELRLG